MNKIKHGIISGLTALMLLVGGLIPSSGQTPHSLPTRPVQIVLPQVVESNLINVSAGQDLQVALDRAQPGDTVVLEAGATFVGRFAFKDKVDNGKWITVRSSRASELGEGIRVSLTDSTKMARLLPPDNLQALDLYPTSNGFTKARKWRFVGIQVEPNPQYLNSNLIKLGTNGSWQSSIGQAPEDIIFDRCLLDCPDNLQAFRAVSICGTRIAFINSYIAGFHVLGGETQAILIANTPGPVLIENNFIEGATENLMSGGLDLRIPNLVPSDITVRRNYFYKRPDWRGRGFGIKNLLELKNAQRVLVEENLFENCWVDGQAGFAIQLTPRNQDGANPWATVRDVTFVNNTILNSSAGFNITGHDDLHSSQQTQRILIRGNTLINFNPASFGNNGRAFQFLYDITDLTVQNNSFAGTPNPEGPSVVLSGAPYQLLRFVFTDNVFPHNGYGVKADGGGEGAAALEQYAPGYVFLRNVILGGQPWSSIYPNDNYFTP